MTRPSTTAPSAPSTSTTVPSRSGCTPASTDPFRAALTTALPQVLTRLGSPAGISHALRSRARLAVVADVVRSSKVPYRHQAARAELTSAVGVWDGSFALRTLEYTTVTVTVAGTPVTLPAWQTPLGLLVDATESHRTQTPLTPAMLRTAEAVLAEHTVLAVRLLPLSAPRYAHVLTPDGERHPHDTWLLHHAAAFTPAAAVAPATTDTPRASRSRATAVHALLAESTVQVPA